MTWQSTHTVHILQSCDCHVTHWYSSTGHTHESDIYQDMCEVHRRTCAHKPSYTHAPLTSIKNGLNRQLKQVIEDHTHSNEWLKTKKTDHTHSPHNTLSGTCVCRMTLACDTPYYSQTPPSPSSRYRGLWRLIDRTCRQHQRSKYTRDSPQCDTSPNTHVHHLIEWRIWNGCGFNSTAIYKKTTCTICKYFVKTEKTRNVSGTKWRFLW